jgi:hypothetical protein
MDVQQFDVDQGTAYSDDFNINIDQHSVPQIAFFWHCAAWRRCWHWSSGPSRRPCPRIIGSASGRATLLETSPGVSVGQVVAQTEATLISPEQLPKMEPSV